MKTNILLLLATFFLTGCGTFYHHQQTFYVKEVGSADTQQPEPSLNVGVALTTTSKHIPFFYYSRKWGGPYSIQFSSNSRPDVCTYFLLHSFYLKSDKTLVSGKRFREPLKLDLCGTELGYQNGYKLYRFPLGESFKFDKDKQIEIEVEFERADDPGVKTILLRGKGEEEKSKTWLFNAYMSV